MSLVEFMREFPDDAACLDYLWRERYSADGEHAECPRCEQVRTFKRYMKSSRPSYTCTGCGLHVNPTAHTIFHKSSTSLQLWFYAIYLMASTRTGVTAKQLERELGVTYKTAWRMFTLIRQEVMRDDEEPIGGPGSTVEADETYVGGKHRYKRGQRPRKGPHFDNKTAVFAAVERGGRVVARAVPSRSDIRPTFHTRVLPGGIVYTDESTLYLSLRDRGYQHETIKHGAYIYVDGDVHTNTVENFFSMLKGSIHGVWKGVSAKHLQGYVNEIQWRMNARYDSQPMFRQLLRNAARPALRY